MYNSFQNRRMEMESDSFLKGPQEEEIMIKKFFKIPCFSVKFLKNENASQSHPSVDLGLLSEATIWPRWHCNLYKDLQGMSKS